MESQVPSPRSDAEPRLSVVIPVFNEEDCLDDLYQRATNVLRQMGKTYELLFIDDGSTDSSPEKLRNYHSTDPSVRVVRFARNFGQQMAVAAGFKYARGGVVVLIDADLQQAPEDIPLLVDKLAEGYDIVYGARAKRLESLVRRVGSWGMSHLLYRVTGIDLPDSVTGFIALNRQFVDTINLFNEKTKYFSGLFAWLSYGRSACVPVSHSMRHSGESKYTIMQLVGLTLNFVCNFTVLPLRFPLYIGGAIVSISLLAMPVLFIAQLLGLVGSHAAAWWCVAVMGLFSGVQLASIGVLGEYLGRVFREVKEQPPFVVREVLDHE